MSGFFTIVRALIACFLLLLFAAAMLTAIQEEDDRAIFFLLSLPVGVTGGLMLRGVLRDRKRAAQADADYRELAVLRLAEAEGGTLTVSQVAARLGWPMEMALAALREVEDAAPVTSTVTSDGVLVFEFLELVHDPTRPPTRPSASPAPPEPAAASPAAVAREERPR